MDLTVNEPAYYKEKFGVSVAGSVLIPVYEFVYPLDPITNYIGADTLAGPLEQIFGACLHSILHFFILACPLVLF